MLQATQMANGSEYKAFYSSDLGGIVTHPALMVVAIDDHMVHRGHAVFDTALLTQVRSIASLIVLDKGSHLLPSSVQCSQMCFQAPLCCSKGARLACLVTTTSLK